MFKKLSLFCIKFSMITLLVFSVSIFAQGNQIISSVTIDNASENKPLKVEAELFSVNNVTSVMLVYKAFGQTEFIQREMQMSGKTAEYVIPAYEVVPPFIELYVKVNASGKTETYPLGMPDAQPMQVSVKAASPKDKEVIFLSPEKGSFAALDDLFISISLLRASDKVDKSATKLYINDEDVSDKAVFAGDMVLFYPGNFPGTVELGKQNIQVELYDKNGKLYHSVSANFMATTRSQFREYATQYQSDFRITGEGRNETYDEESTFYSNVNAKYNGSYKDWDFYGNVYLTSEDKDNTQPYHRFTARVESDWFRLTAGDNYPVYPSLIMNGKRVRGISGALKFGFFNIEASFGETDRAIEGELLDTFTEGNAPLASNIIAINQAKYGNAYGEIDEGTYKRSLFALRPSFGSGENFQLGFTYLHSKDDEGSIEFGTSPEENLLLGTDLLLAFDDSRIQFRAQGAFSLVNSDINAGSFTDSQIDSLFESVDYGTDLQTVKDVKNALDNFITVNQYLGPLNPQEFSSSAYETSLKLDYGSNNFIAKYIYRGNEFHSFGNPFIRTDVKGINITDRIRLWDNKLFFNIGYETLEDNLQETKLATTDYKTINASVSIFPRTNFPNLTLGITNYANENGLNVTDPDSTLRLAAVDDVTNRIYGTITYDIRTSVRHKVYLNLSTSSTEDNSINNYDGSTSSATFMFNSYWTRKLDSFLTLTYYNSDLSGLEYKYTSVSVGGRYRMLDDKLELRGSITPSFGDFERQSFELTGSYYFMPNFIMNVQFRIYNVPDESTDSIIGASFRYNI